MTGIQSLFFLLLLAIPNLIATPSEASDKLVKGQWIRTVTIIRRGHDYKVATELERYSDETNYTEFHSKLATHCKVVMKSKSGQVLSSAFCKFETFPAADLHSSEDKYDGPLVKPGGDLSILVFKNDGRFRKIELFEDSKLVASKRI